MIEQQRVYRIKDVDSLLGFLREDLCWELPEASIDDVSFEWTGLDLNLSEDIHKKLKGGLIRQLQPFAGKQPWGIFVVEFTTREVSIIILRQILRCFVAKRRGARPDLPAWQCENLLFICLYGENGFTFAHFKGDKPYSARLTTFSWHPGEPIRTVCEFNLPALVHNDTWTPETWVTEWQKAFDVEKVNKQFYQQISQFYYRLTGREGYTRELVLPYVGDDPGSISIYEEFVVRLIGRSIFCWFLKHKVSEESNVPLIPPEALSLAAARETEDFYHSMLEPLFFEVMNKPFKDRKSLPIPRSEIIPFLNGGLFEPHHNDFYADAPNYGLKIPDAWFIDFFSLLEKYNFTITENSSIDVDVAVDPEMLGRIFENLLAEVMPETGETARKATGSYYTPRAIVDYMVEQSLRQYLLTKTALGEGKVERLLGFGESVEDFSPEEKLATVTALREIKVIDPACGSGAFLMGALHRMLSVMEKVDPRLELWRAQYLKSLDGIVRQTVEKNISRENWAYIRKLMIIRDSVYGVDIQPIAVEIAKLRCFLSLVVDEIVLDDEENRGIEPLPNLEFKFVAANTLIGLPPKVERQGAFGVSDAIKRLKELREDYLRSAGAEKIQVEKEFKTTQHKLFDENIKWAMPDAQVTKLTEWDPFYYKSCGWFDPEWMFGVDGFDIVIANPPYINAINFKNIYGDNLRAEYNQRFETASGTYDIFVLFFEQGLTLLTSTGCLCLITPNKYLSAKYATSLRSHILKHSTIMHLADLSTIDVFDTVSVYPIITILRNGNSSRKDTISILQPNDREESTFEIDKFHLITVPHNMLTMLPEYIWGFLLSDKAAYLNSIIEGTKPLSRYGEINATSTASESDSYSVHFSNNKGQQSLKVINTGTIDRYTSLWGIKDLKYGGTSYLTPYLNLDKANVNQYRRDMYSHSKIIFAKMAISCEAFLDLDGEYASVNTNCFYKPKDEVSLKYLLAYCNSRLFMFFYEQFFGALRMSGGYFQFQAPQLRVIPTRHPNSKDVISKFEEKVDKIVISKQENPEANTIELEREIDRMIYELYELTPEEIAVVEGNSSE